MARKRRVTRTQVSATLPNSVELTKRNSSNSMTLEIRTGDDLLGTRPHLNLSRLLHIEVQLTPRAPTAA